MNELAGSYLYKRSQKKKPSLCTISPCANSIGRENIGPIENKRVKFSVLPAGVDTVWKVVKKRQVEMAAPRMTRPAPLSQRIPLPHGIPHL